MDEKTKLFRKYGYDIVINNFETLLREYIVNEVFNLNYGLKGWKKHIPIGVRDSIKEEKEIDVNNIKIEDYFDELTLLNLKDIAIFSDNYDHMKQFVTTLHKNKFINLMDELNQFRRKIAHAKRKFSKLDLSRTIDIVKEICQGEITKNLNKYIDNEAYKTAQDIPATFFQESRIPHNLPFEDYDLDGGFVGRRKEIDQIKKLLYSDQDRIITLTGAGGIGKTAVAIKTLYYILYDNGNPFDAIIWFSAKTSKLTSDKGIIEIESDITNYELLIKDVLRIVDNKTFHTYENADMPISKYQDHLYKIFSSQKCLLAIDNLETIKDEETVNFIKNIPRPSQVLITSRRGLGEIERRYALPDFNEQDALVLFRLIGKERSRIDLLKLTETAMKKLVNTVKCYPLLIKWSIGKVCLGVPIEDAFSEIHSGKSEIAEFIFNDIFQLFTKPAKLCLYSMIFLGEKPISQHMLMHLANTDSDEFEEAIRELIVTSFVIQEVTSDDEKIDTTYTMLSLTRGFVSNQLDNDTKAYGILNSRYSELEHKIEQVEKSERALTESFDSLGIKTDDEKIAFNFVHSAQNFIFKDDYKNAEKSFEEALKISPNFTYALLEYAKFEFRRGNTPKCNRLYGKAIKADPENYLVYFRFGTCLKYQENFPKAIECFKKALELNPDYLPIYNELGRVYSITGRYDLADKHFEKAQKQKEYRNFRHRIITLYYTADNLRRWSEDFFRRKDFPVGMSKLKEALLTIERANKENKGDKKSMILEKKICLQFAINLSENDNFDEAIQYYERCLQPIKLSSGATIFRDEEMAKGYYYYAYYGFKNKKFSPEDLLIYIIKGKAITNNIKFISRFSKLENDIIKKHNLKPPEKNIGFIEWFNIVKKYGVIRCENETHLFFLGGVNKRIEGEELYNLEGKTVSFDLIPDPKKENSKLAVNIKFE